MAEVLKYSTWNKGRNGIVSEFWLKRQIDGTNILLVPSSAIYYIKDGGNPFFIIQGVSIMLYYVLSIFIEESPTCYMANV